MTTLNAAASEAALAAGVVAATDVTGFSLLGHLHRMLRASGARAVVSAAAVPLLPGALELTAAGYVSGGTRNNMAYLEPWVSFDAGCPSRWRCCCRTRRRPAGCCSRRRRRTRWWPSWRGAACSRRSSGGSRSGGLAGHIESARNAGLRALRRSSRRSGLDPANPTNSP